MSPAGARRGTRMKYVYPAKIENDEGHLLVTFPDLPECFTEGDSLVEALELAEDALEMMLTQREDQGDQIPEPTLAGQVHCEPGETVALVKADTVAYRRRTSKASVKKTLTIPAWLDNAAEHHGVNYSKLLQDALIRHLHME